jgi:folate-binding protein YgfZ
MTLPEGGRLAGLATGGFAFPLGARERVRVTGADALRYLDGQLSNSVHKATADQAIEGLLLTARGKLCARVFVWREGEGFLLDADVGVELLPRVSRYAVADDVEFEQLPSTATGWHVCGVAVRGLACTRMGQPGWDCPQPPSGIPIASPEEIELLRIARGVPQWGAELDPDVLPHEAGLDRTAVDFHKGCYVGQEVVSRIESVGRTNRILRGFLGDFPPQGGLRLHDAEREVGRLTSGSRHLELPHTVALGYVNPKSSATDFAVHAREGGKVGQCHTYEFPLF